jgi:hypothetical protein
VPGTAPTVNVGWVVSTLAAFAGAVSVGAAGMAGVTKLRVSDQSPTTVDEPSLFLPRTRQK